MRIGESGISFTVQHDSQRLESSDESFERSAGSIDTTLSTNTGVDVNLNSSSSFHSLNLSDIYTRSVITDLDAETVREITHEDLVQAIADGVLNNDFQIRDFRSLEDVAATRSLEDWTRLSEMFSTEIVLATSELDVELSPTELLSVDLELSRQQLESSIRLSETDALDIVLPSQDEVQLSQSGQIDFDNASELTNDNQTTPSSVITIEENHYLQDEEILSIRSEGRVTLEDGREIEFTFQLDLEHHYQEQSETKLSLEEVRLTDPLVISLDGSAPGFSSGYFDFDMQSDGEEQSYRQLAAGTGFLAIDRNGDGVINDGSELFGPQTGSGFSELAEFDSDGNGWIDEADEGFADLLVWRGGGDVTMSLKDTGMGAIYLGATQTDYRFTDDANNTLGQLTHSSIALKETGEVTGIYQINLADMTEQKNQAEGNSSPISGVQISVPIIPENNGFGILQPRQQELSFSGEVSQLRIVEHTDTTVKIEDDKESLLNSNVYYQDYHDPIARLRGLDIDDAKDQRQVRRHDIIENILKPMQELAKVKSKKLAENYKKT